MVFFMGFSRTDPRCGIIKRHERYQQRRVGAAKAQMVLVDVVSRDRAFERGPAGAAASVVQSALFGFKENHLDLDHSGAVLFHGGLDDRSRQENPRTSPRTRPDSIAPAALPARHPSPRERH